MKKSKFVRSSIILIMGGLITKLLGMLIKIVLTRNLKTTGIGLYSMISPTLGLLISISGFGLAPALNVLIATKKYNNKNLIISALFVSLSIDMFIMVFLHFSSSYIATNLLKNNILTLPILCIGFILPFISISNILRSYFFANERMLPHTISNIIEDIIKLLLIFFFLKYLLSNVSISLSFIILTNIFCELSSIIIFFFCLPKFKITFEDLKLNIKNIKAILKIALPTTLSRLIGSITYFLEPIILTTMLLKYGYSNQYIVEEYGIINGYVLPIILLPSFFTSAISQALIPIVSKNYSNHNYKEIKRKLSQALHISLTLGIIFTLIFITSSPFILKLLYNTNKGINYILFLAPLFIFYYLEYPLLSTLQAMNKAKINLKISLINMMIRTIGLILLINLKLGIYSLLIVLILNIIFTCIYSYYNISKLLRQ